MIKQAIVLMRSSIPQVQYEACRLITNISNSLLEVVDNVTILGGHNIFLSFLEMHSIPHQQVASMGLCNLSKQQRYHKVLMSCGVLEPFLSILRDPKYENIVKFYD